MPDTASERVETNADGDAFRYYIDAEGCACIVRCESHASCICIPETLGGSLVVELAESSFSGLAEATEIRCPHCLRRIGGLAFAGCARLRDVSFNEGLAFVGEEAFSMCGALGEIVLPSSVRMIGANVSGGRGGMRSPSVAAVRVASDSDYLFVDDDVVYARVEDADGGLALVDASQFSRSVLSVRPETVRIGARAIARNAAIAKVLLPEGLREIGEGAFRGCSNLVEVVLPSTLVSIRSGAFSCTSLRSLSVPERCTDIDPGALCTGPVFPGSSRHSFSSALRAIDVHPDNPEYCLCGNVLCRRVGEGGLKAVLAAGEVAEVHLPKEVARVAAPTFAGTVRVGTLHLHDGITYTEEPGLLPHGSCERIVIDFSEPREGFSSISLDIPEGRAGSRLLTDAFSAADGRIDVERFVASYDETLLSLEDRLGQARRIAQRLAAPLYLAQDLAETFRRIIGEAFESICLHFGARNYWAGFDHLVAAGLLDAKNIPDLVGKLLATGNALAAGYLLDLKRQRFGKVALDYGI